MSIWTKMTSIFTKNDHLEGLPRFEEYKAPKVENIISEREIEAEAADAASEAATSKRHTAIENLIKQIEKARNEIRNRTTNRATSHKESLAQYNTDLDRVRQKYSSHENILEIYKSSLRLDLRDFEKGIETVIEKTKEFNNFVYKFGVSDHSVEESNTLFSYLIVAIFFTLEVVVASYLLQDFYNQLTAIGFGLVIGAVGIGCGWLTAFGLRRVAHFRFVSISEKIVSPFFFLAGPAAFIGINYTLLALRIATKEATHLDSGSSNLTLTLFDSSKVLNSFTDIESVLLILSILTFAFSIGHFYNHFGRGEANPALADRKDALLEAKKKIQTKYTKTYETASKHAEKTIKEIEMAQERCNAIDAQVDKFKDKWATEYSFFQNEIESLEIVARDRAESYLKAYNSVRGGQGMEDKLTKDDFDKWSDEISTLFAPQSTSGIDQLDPTIFDDTNEKIIETKNLCKDVRNLLLQQKNRINADKTEHAVMIGNEYEKLENDIRNTRLS